MIHRAVVPLHLARSSTLIGSSLGGLSFGGSLGANFFGSSTWTCPVSAMTDVCGIFAFVDEINKEPRKLLPVCALTFPELVLVKDESSILGTWLSWVGN